MTLSRTKFLLIQGNYIEQSTNQNSNYKLIVLYSVERESTESAQAKRSDFQETSQKVVEFQKKLDLVKEQVYAYKINH